MVSDQELEPGLSSPPTGERGNTGPKVTSFTTERGSVYTYDEDGKTTRFKTATGEEHPRQDITVFADLDDPAVHLEFLEVYHKMGNPDLKVYVLERGQDDTGAIVRDVADVQDPNRLYLGLVKGGRITKNVPASLTPFLGARPFDTRRFQEGGQWKTERHIGHKVIHIDYDS